MMEFVKHYAYASEDGGIYLVGELYEGREYLQKVWLHIKSSDTIEDIKAKLRNFGKICSKDKHRVFEINNKTDKVWQL